MIIEGAFWGTYFRDIYSSVTGKWYKKSWKKFDQLKDVDQKFYRLEYYDISVKCETSLRFWENKALINEIDSYGWFQWYFRYCLDIRLEDDEGQVNRWNKLWVGLEVN